MVSCRALVFSFVSSKREREARAVLDRPDRIKLLRLVDAADCMNGFAQGPCERQRVVRRFLPGTDDNRVDFQRLRFAACFDVEPGVVDFQIGYIAGHRNAAEHHLQEVCPSPRLAQASAETVARLALEKMNLADGRPLMIGGQQCARLRITQINSPLGGKSLDVGL